VCANDVPREGGDPAFTNCAQRRGPYRAGRPARRPSGLAPAGSSPRSIFTSAARSTLCFALLSPRSRFVWRVYSLQNSSHSAGSMRRLVFCRQQSMNSCLPESRPSGTNSGPCGSQGEVGRERQRRRCYCYFRCEAVDIRFSGQQQPASCTMTTTGHLILIGGGPPAMRRRGRQR
jgi:hypothetical protein